MLLFNFEIILADKLAHCVYNGCFLVTVFFSFYCFFLTCQSLPLFSLFKTVLFTLHTLFHSSPHNYCLKQLVFPLFIHLCSRVFLDLLLWIAQLHHVHLITSVSFFFIMLIVNNEFSQHKSVFHLEHHTIWNATKTSALLRDVRYNDFLPATSGISHSGCRRWMVSHPRLG